MEKTLDLITIGRSSVDLYGSQVGGRLEDMRSFSKYIGGSPTNIAAGAARLGLRSGLITRVGDEHMGRFIREQLQREGVDVRGVKTDPERLTALVILGIRDDKTFPLIFYREDCADMALSEEDIEPDYIASARCVCATGTHLSHPRTEAAVMHALDLARSEGARTALDIDFRPNLWGLAGHADGESRYIESSRVTAKLKSTLKHFDLIVGTEEEFHIAGGTTNTLDALCSVREASDATLVCKRGPLGASVFSGSIPRELEDGITGQGFKVEVFNVLGAGDGFMAGLLKGWLSDAGWAESIRIANACGALAVSRHGCTPSYPSLPELEHFLVNGSTHEALRKDKKLEQIHWSTNRKPEWPVFRIFDLGNSGALEQRARELRSEPERVSEFHELCLDAVIRVANSRKGFGIVCDDDHGRAALRRASDHELWIGRSVDANDTRSPDFKPELGADLGGLSEWPSNHVLICRCVCHSSRATSKWKEQLARISRLFAAARRNRLEIMVELDCGSSDRECGHLISYAISSIYSAGVFPDLWQVSTVCSLADWKDPSSTIHGQDPHCRGMILGPDVSFEDIPDSLHLAKGHLLRGFSVNARANAEIFEAWLSNRLGNSEAIQKMAGSFASVSEKFDRSVARSKLQI